MDKTNFEKWRELKNDEQNKNKERKKALFDKVNFMSLGCESDYERLFKNKKILKLYKKIDKEVTKLVYLMAEEID